MTVVEKRADTGDLKLACLCVNQDGKEVITGTAEVRAPTEKVRRPRAELPDVRLAKHERFHALLARAQSLPPLPTAVAH
ncbi:hypothetical protein, partial [Streptomyces roseofulvus]